LNGSAADLPPDAHPCGGCPVPFALGAGSPPNRVSIRPTSAARNECCKMCGGYSVCRGSGGIPPDRRPRKVFAACIAVRLTPCRWQPGPGRTKVRPRRAGRAEPGDTYRTSRRPRASERFYG
jgi:hypothetical protein